MKKLLFFIVLIIICYNVNAQDQLTNYSGEPSFGIKAGFNSLINRACASGVSVSEDAAVFYVGVFADLPLSEKFSIQPEVQYVNVSKSSESSGFLLFPILAKYKIIEGFGVLAGQQLDILLPDLFIGENFDDFENTGVGITAGLEYYFAENIFIDARYSFGLTNRLGDFDIDGVDIKLNYFQAGLGYRF